MMKGLMKVLMNPTLHGGVHGLPDDPTTPQRMARHWLKSRIENCLSSPGCV
jgi:hypothetical protein